MSDPAADGKQVVSALYAHFAAREGRAMAALYAEHATFSDPVFPALRGAEIGAMWDMLASSAPELQVTLDELRADAGARPGAGEVFVARWTARYPFSRTGRRVTNLVTSTIAVDGGRIVRQRDEFDFLSWQAQALGPFGRLLGWTGLPGLLLRRAAGHALARFQARRESSQRA